MRVAPLRAFVVVVAVAVEVVVVGAVGLVGLVGVVGVVGVVVHRRVGSVILLRKNVLDHKCPFFLSCSSCGWRDVNERFFFCHCCCRCDTIYAHVLQGCHHIYHTSA